MFEILVILALILLNGVFSGAEIAILSVRKTRLAELVEEGSGAARAVAKLRENPESFLATVQIGITVVGATAAAFGGAAVAGELRPLFAAVPFLLPYADNLALGTVVAAVSFLSLVLGELVPKSLALRAGEPYALAMGRPLEALAWAGRPLIALLTGASNLVLRLFGDRTTFSETRLSREEIQQIVEEATTSGSVDPHAGEIASRALDFSRLDAYTAMVPRSDLVMLPKTADAQDVARAARKSGYARVPVYDGLHDNVIGVVNLRDALAEATLGPSFTLDALLHPILFVADSMPAPALLRRLQADHAHLALVIDEQGTIVGLVTIEDLLEELVGEILSENDKPVVEPAKDADGGWLLRGSTPVHEVNRRLSVELPEGDFATLAGLCLHLAGTIPVTGTLLETEDGVTLEIVDATPRRVRRVRIKRPGRAARESS
ncbi:MAG: hemolysin family protein [Pseudomonadota bacterium]|nr:hemolysin family protein [Pseudomonadota bacterium]